jgi:hypothetical protein
MGGFVQSPTLDALKRRIEEELMKQSPVPNLGTVLGIPPLPGPRTEPGLPPSVTSVTRDPKWLEIMKRPGVQNLIGAVLSRAFRADPGTTYKMMEERRGIEREEQARRELMQFQRELEQMRQQWENARQERGIRAQEERDLRLARREEALSSKEFLRQLELVGLQANLAKEAQKDRNEFEERLAQMGYSHDEKMRMLQFYDRMALDTAARKHDWSLEEFRQRNANNRAVIELMASQQMARARGDLPPSDASAMEDFFLTQVMEEVLKDPQYAPLKEPLLADEKTLSGLRERFQAEVNRRLVNRMRSFDPSAQAELERERKRQQSLEALSQIPPPARSSRTQPLPATAPQPVPAHLPTVLTDPGTGRQVDILSLLARLREQRRRH